MPKKKLKQSFKAQVNRLAITLGTNLAQALVLGLLAGAANYLTHLAIENKIVDAASGGLVGGAIARGLARKS